MRCAVLIRYGMTKTAQSAISRGLAGLTKGTKVPVNCSTTRADRSRILREGPAALSIVADDRT